MLIASQRQIFCGISTSYAGSKIIEGGGCDSHLRVGADSRYRQPADFSISYKFVTGRAPQRSSGKAKADLSATFRNQSNARTETIELTDVSCSVAK